MSVYHLYSPIIQISRAASASTQIFAIIDAELPDTSGLKKDGIPVSGQDIVFRDVTFSYPSRPNTTILDKLNVRFEKGKTTAIVGPSGSGKSTIVGLIEKWYNPINESLDGSPISYVEPLSEKIGATIGTKEILSSGIYIGDVNLNIIDSKWWRSNIGLVQQEPFLFNDTIFKNVANGLAGTDYENISVERKLTMVQKACTEAFADDFISRLPLGYDTVVGEGGLKLSGGQRQRIAIARAIIKDPSILILDEATSAIDVRTEKLVQQVLDKVSQHRTTITIAHRLSTIQKADKIIVLRNGKSIEEGVHEELLQKEDGLYATLVRAQAVEIGKDEDPDPDAITVERDSEAQDALLPLEEQQLSILQDEDKPKPPKGGFLARFSLLLREQRSKWLLLAILTFSAMCGSGKGFI
jgi:ABC-type multidrug transport system fused ATPase/permease subunit